MKKIVYSLFVFLLIAAFLPSTVSAKTLNDDKVVFGGTFNLSDGDTLNGNLIILGGTATLDQDSTVTGDIVLLGGTLTAGGTVNGNVIVVGGSAHLKKSAYVFGDLITASSSVEQDNGATIAGTVRQNFTTPFRVPFSSEDQTSPETKPGFTAPDLNPLLKTSRIGFRSFGVAILAMLLAMIFPNALKRVIHPILTAPIISGGFGLLTIFLAPVVLVMIAITFNWYPCLTPWDSGPCICRFPGLGCNWNRNREPSCPWLQITMAYSCKCRSGYFTADPGYSNHWAYLLYWLDHSIPFQYARIRRGYPNQIGYPRICKKYNC